MSSAALDQVFSVPFRHLESTQINGEFTASMNRPLGLARFVGDQPNVLLKYFANPDSLDLSTLELQFPIILFGPSGTGKTSLALTIVSELATQFESVQNSAASIPLDIRPVQFGKPQFLSALDFDRRFRSALETNSVIDFRNRLMQSGGLIIDDLQRLEGKSAAQNEFVLILDEMCRKNRPILITMETSPQQSNGLIAGLVSRLSSGLSIPINPPGPSARREIIRDLAAINQVPLTEDATSLLVDRLQVTVPKLNHVFAQIKNALEAKKADPSLMIDAAKLTQIFKKSVNDLESLSQLIISKVAAAFDLKPDELKSDSRKQSIVMARGVAIYLNRRLLGTSFLKIGTYFGNRDHSTIMHANRKIETLMNNTETSVDSRSTRTTIDDLKQQLTEQFASQINFV